MLSSNDDARAESADGRGICGSRSTMRMSKTPTQVSMNIGDEHRDH